MIKQKQIPRFFKTEVFTILGLIVGLWIGGCTRAVYIGVNETKSDSGNAGDLANKTKDIEAIRLDGVATVDVTKKDWGNKDGGMIPGTWTTISSGTFMMGSPTGEACRYSNETQHQVTLTRSFEIQTTEVTQAQFQTLMGYNPSYFKSCGTNCPVEEVSWHEAAAYCNALSTQGGYTKCYNCNGSGTSVTCAENGSYSSGNIYDCPGYRLPTEAEWEYAYRAGATTSLHNNTNVVNCTSNDPNTSAVSWNYYNSSTTSHAVGGKPVNNWGLYDMAGNVWEWVHDMWDGTAYGSSLVTDPWGQSSGGNRVTRGGSWYNDPFHERAAFRDNDAPTYRSYCLGIRCVRTK